MSAVRFGTTAKLAIVLFKVLVALKQSDNILDQTLIFLSVVRTRNLKRVDASPSAKSTKRLWLNGSYPFTKSCAGW